jgi:transposase
MVAEVRSDHESEWAAMTKVAQLLGVGTPETVRKWCRRAEVDAGARPGVTSEDSAELKRLKRENAELKRRQCDLEGGLGFLRVNDKLILLGGVRSFLRCPGSAGGLSGDVRLRRACSEQRRGLIGACVRARLRRARGCSVASPPVDTRVLESAAWS